VSNPSPATSESARTLAGPPVSEVTAAAYVIPTDAPESDGTLSWDSTGLIVVTARAGDQQGLGWSYGSPVSAHLVNDLLAGLVRGTSALDTAAASTAMNRAVRNLGREGIASIAISATDIALWDLKARLLGMPLAGLLGQHQPDVPVYGSGGFVCYDEQQTRDQLSGWVNENKIPRVKIKIGESWGTNERRDRDRVALARNIIGDEAELFVDANGAYDTGQAVRVGRWLAVYGVSWFEEPVTSQDLAGLAVIRNQVTADVTAGEYSWTLADSARLLEAGAVDCLQIDVTRCGGITGFMAAAGLAYGHNMPVSGHCAPNAHAHVASATPNLRHLEYFHDHQRIEGMLFDGALNPAGGVLTPDLQRPGHGLEFKAADAERFRTI
jgi:L-alanine-DL-glutamate epimerase-like enolase superfamily enzyme